MSSFPLRSPTSSSSHRGFHPLQDHNGYGDMDDRHDNIPLEQLRSNGSGGLRKDGDGSGLEDFTSPPPQAEEHRILGGGRRKLQKLNSKDRSGTGESHVTGLGKFYQKVISFSPVIRHIVYIIPIGALIAVPIIVGATVPSAENYYIGGVRLVWFFTWIEVVWLSVWIAKLVAQLLPSVFMFLSGVVSSGTRKYALVIKNLEVPLSLVLWAAAALATFQVLMVTAPGNKPDNWVNVVRNILAPLLIASGIYLGEKLIIQLISISYHQRSFEGRIKESKRALFLIGLLYEASRTLFPMYCKEFEDEDVLISGSIEALFAKSRKAKNRLSGSATPMALIANLGRVGDKLTSAFGNIASEISGKQVFNPNSAHSIVVEALEKKRSSEALARRLWMSFVVEGRESLYLDDFQEVLGPARHAEANEAFAALDRDANGDISLDEMIVKVVEIGRDRKAINKSMNDVGQAIGVLDQILVTVVFVIVVFVIIAFQNTNFVTTLATAGTTLLSLSFVFAVTTQEFLGSCIFLFVKHPYDVGDRVDINGGSSTHLIVEQISLLYTIFKNVENMKMVQVPNIVLNSVWIENISRSKAMKEQLEMFISFDTSIEDIELLRLEMESFVRHPDNSRDFQSDVILECTGIGSMDKLVLKVEIKHKSNWANDTVRAARRSKFMCALVLALRKVPIYAPGGGGLALGDPGNPSYSVTVTDELAIQAREKHTREKDEKRLVPSKPAETPAVSTGKSTGVQIGGASAERRAAETINARRPTDDGGLDEEDTLNSRSESLDRVRSNELENLRQGLLARASTRGKRRAGERVPQVPLHLHPVNTGTTNQGSSLERMRSYDIEEGIESRTDGGMYDGSGYSQAPRVGPLTGNQSYSMFPPAARAATQNPSPGQHRVPPPPGRASTNSGASNVRRVA